MDTKKTRKRLGIIALSLIMCLSLASCGASSSTNNDSSSIAKTEQTSFTGLTKLVDTSEQFTDRDLEQTADLTNAEKIAVESGKDVTLTKEGVYVISGTAKDTSIIVDADDTAKIQIVLDGVTITNSDTPAIYVKNADKTFVTTADGSENKLTVSGTFAADGNTNTDAVIFAKDDLTLNGLGTVTIDSTKNGISGKDDIKITGGTYIIKSGADAVEANDSIRIAGGTFTIDAGKDAFHAECDEDNTVGYVYIAGGEFDITATDDGIQATTYAIIDGGTFDIDSAEGIEGTYAQVNDGKITIEASDDGINAAQKTTDVNVIIEINGGTIDISMAQGDTDALDANGDLKITGGTINITAQSPFDYDGTGVLSGGTVTVNGEKVSELTNSMQGGGGPGGHPGQDGSKGFPW